MDMIGKEVLHKKFGQGSVIAQEQGYIMIRFECGDKKFQYPEAFREFLTLNDPSSAETVAAEIKAEDQAKKAVFTTPKNNSATTNTMRTVTRVRANRPNIAFKCNYCDGGASSETVGFSGVCSDAIIYNNIDVEHRTWCCSEECACLDYRNGEITRDDLEALMEDGGFVCYESQMLREWKAMAGIIQRGERKGQPMRLANVQTNSVCVLTTREPDSAEDERFIFAVFLIDDTYDGDDFDEGFVSTKSKYKIKLSPDEAHKMPFWKYHANDNQPEVAAWNSGLHRYLTDEQAAQILRDIVKLKHGTRDQSLAEEFFDTFCTLTKVDPGKIGAPVGALTM